MAMISEAKTPVREMIPTQIDFVQRNVAAPKYRFLRVPMNNNSSGIVEIGPTESQQIEFKLPTSKAYNMSRSIVSYVREIPKQGALNAAWVHEDMFSLGNTITFGSAGGGQDLVNLQYANNFSKIQRKLHTPTDEFMATSSATSSVSTGLQRFNDVNTNNLVTGGVMNSRDPLTPSTAVYTASDSYMEAQYSSHTAVDTASIKGFQYPLGAFKGTFLGVDRDYYSPVEQYLRITCGPANKAAYIGTSVSVPITGQAELPVKMKFTQIVLFLAVEENSNLISTLMDEYQRGVLKFSIPFTTGFRTPGTGAADSQTNISISLSRQYGKRLKKVLHSVFHQTESLSTAYDHDNGNGKKIKSYQSFLDNVALQDRVLDCRRPDSTGVAVYADDYAENKRFLKNSALIGYNQYALNWFHLDQFYDPFEVVEKKIDDVNLEDGLPMDIDRQWMFSGASVSAYQVHYTWAEFSRDVLMTLDGPTFV